MCSTRQEGCGQLVDKTVHRRQHSNQNCEQCVIINKVSGTATRFKHLAILAQNKEAVSVPRSAED